MKLSQGNSIVGVKVCSDTDDYLLTTLDGKCIRTAVSKLRTTKSRSSEGVRGIKLSSQDKIISLSILSHTDASSGEIKAYLKMQRDKKIDVDDSEDIEQEDDGVEAVNLSEDMFSEMQAREQFILTVTENGYGKRSDH